MYFDAKKPTPGLESKLESLRNELDAIMRKTVAVVGKVSDSTLPAVIAFDFRRNLVNENQGLVDTMLKLSIEIMLRVQAENEVKSLKVELEQKRANLALIRLTSLDKSGNAPPMPLRLRENVSSYSLDALHEATSPTKVQTRAPNYS
ncbi:hypothetical protein Ciccas_003666 [Cichlidogyrus casuarinus]|uniref:Spermatogenesis-associated protein 1 C-terminal domain-containing protein n=1 Tax=Cichlidogyrus casuarinus TaxID=1844966 RepID=A0ABD2QDQ7_9PLAT